MSQISSTGCDDEAVSATPGAPGTGDAIALFGGSPSAALALLSGSLCSPTVATQAIDSFFAPFASPACVSNNDCVVGAGAVALCPLLPNMGFPPGAALLSLSERGGVFAGGVAGFLDFRSSSAAFTAAACASSISRILAAERWYERLKLSTCPAKS